MNSLFRRRQWQEEAKFVYYRIKQCHSYILVGYSVVFGVTYI